MKINGRQFDRLVESLVEQALNKRFASSDPFKTDKDFARLSKYIESGNYFFHFSETGKIGINPQSTDHPGVRGFYGFKLTHDEFFNEEDYDWFTRRKYIIIFKLKPRLKILELKNEDHLDNVLKKGQEVLGLRKEPLELHLMSTSEQTRILQKMGYDGLWSGEKFFMTDIKNELVVFPPYGDKIDVVEIMKNPLHLLKQNRKTFNRKYDPSDPEPEVRVPSKYKNNGPKDKDPVDLKKIKNQRRKRRNPQTWMR